MSKGRCETDASLCKLLLGIPVVVSKGRRETDASLCVQDSLFCRNAGACICVSGLGCSLHAYWVRALDSSGGRALEVREGGCAVLRNSVIGSARAGGGASVNADRTVLEAACCTFYPCACCPSCTIHGAGQPAPSLFCCTFPPYPGA